MIVISFLKTKDLRGESVPITTAHVQNTGRGGWQLLQIGRSSKAITSRRGSLIDRAELERRQGMSDASHARQYIAALSCRQQGSLQLTPRPIEMAGRNIPPLVA